MCPYKSETRVANYYKTTDALQVNFYKSCSWMKISTYFALDM